MLENKELNNFYALQVRLTREINFIKQVKKHNIDFFYKLYFPIRKLDLRKRGKVKPTNSAIFPGYVFLEIDDAYALRDCLKIFREVEGFERFLISNSHISPLRSRDLDIILRFISIGPVLERSKVMFDENSRIVVLQGPLMGLEGHIVKVDRRKKRAKIKLDIYNDSLFIDLSFEVIEKAKP